MMEKDHAQQNLAQSQETLEKVFYFILKCLEFATMIIVPTMWELKYR